MDYEKENEKLNSGSDVFKPEAGIYKVTILSEPEETEYKDSDGSVTPQIKLLVEHNLDKENKQWNWFVGKGATTRSTFGQLMVIGKAKGKLLGEIITLIVKEGSDNKKDYTIQEAAEIIQAEKVSEEAVEDGA